MYEGFTTAEVSEIASKFQICKFCLSKILNFQHLLVVSSKVSPLSYCPSSCLLFLFVHAKLNHLVETSSLSPISHSSFFRTKKYLRCLLSSFSLSSPPLLLLSLSSPHPLLILPPPLLLFSSSSPPPLVFPFHYFFILSLC